MEKQEWFISLGMGFHGPFTTEQIQQRLQNAEVGRDNLVWADGMHDWLPLVKVDVFEPFALKGVPFVHESPWMEAGEQDFSTVLKGIPGQNLSFSEASVEAPQSLLKNVFSFLRRKFSK